MTHTDHLSGPVTRASALQPILVVGFAAAIGLWTLWFVTHLPWLRIEERVSMPLLVGAWFLMFVASGYGLGRARALSVGAGGGVVSALLGLLVLGSKLRPHGVTSGVPDAAVYPSAPLIAIGFLAAGTVLGTLGTLVGSRFSRREGRAEPEWFGRFAWVTCAAAAPLLFVGGLVTSTNSGMAVPDWPNTYGTNMFLYPLGPRASPDVFLEHAHRLFGTLMGCTSIVLTVWAWVSRQSMFSRAMSTALLLFIIVQGVLGGARVLQDSRWMAVFHGVSAQVIFAGLVGLAVHASPAYRSLATLTPPPPARKLRVFATAAMHSLLLQLVFGAMYRHLRSAHVLWTHAGFAFLVLVAALMAGFAACAFAPAFAGHASVRSLRRAGGWLVGVVGLQFALGWAAFMSRGQGVEAANAGAALVRTAHQANGALLLGVTTVVFMMARRASRLESASSRA